MNTKAKMVQSYHFLLFNFTIDCCKIVLQCSFCNRLETDALRVACVYTHLNDLNHLFNSVLNIIKCIDVYICLYARVVDFSKCELKCIKNIHIFI